MFSWSTEIEANRKISWWGMGGVLLNKAYLIGEEEKLNFYIIRDMKMQISIHLILGHL